MLRIIRKKYETFFLCKTMKLMSNKITSTSGWLKKKKKRYEVQEN